TPRYPTATGPRSGRAVAAYPRAVSVVVADFAQTGEHRLAFGVHLEVQLIDERLARPAMAHDEVFELLQPSQVHPQLRIAPARVLAHRGPREAVIAALDLQSPALLGRHAVDQQQQAPRLRLQLVERRRQHFTDETMGQTHVFRRGLDVLDGARAARAGLDFPLVLVEQRDSLYQRQELHVIAPRADHVVGKGLLVRVLVHHADGLEQPLRVAVQPDQRGAFLPRPQTIDGLRLALLPVNGARLLAVLVDREHDATIQQFFVHVVRRRGEKEHHRAFHAVLVCHVLTAHRVLAGGGDLQHAFRLQQLQRVGGAARAFLFGYGQNLVLQVFLPHVEQRLAGHGRVLLALLFRHEVQHRFHQRAFAGRG